MSAASDWDWALLVSVVGVAAAVSTAVAAGVTLYLRLREQPEPEWGLEGAVTGLELPGVRHRRGKEAPNQEIEVSAVLSNAGDGVAYGVKVSGYECSSGMFLGRNRTPVQVQSLMKSGDVAEVWVRFLRREWPHA